MPDSHPHRITSEKCHVNTVVSPDDGHTVTRNMQRIEINVLRNIVHQVGFNYEIIYSLSDAAIFLSTIYRTVQFSVYMFPIKYVFSFTCGRKDVPADRQI